MITRSKLEELFDEVIEPDDREIWSNDDVPPFSDIIGDGDTVEFECPGYDANTQRPCDEEFKFSFGSDTSKNRENFKELLDESGGTMRCEVCNEPVYAWYGRGDYRGD